MQARFRLRCYPFGLFIPIRNQLVAQASRLCTRRLRPAATKNCSLTANCYQSLQFTLLPFPLQEESLFADVLPNEIFNVPIHDPFGKQHHIQLLGVEGEFAE
jgi:hypothetical protein